MALKASGALLQELHRTGGNRDFTLKRCTQNLMCITTKGKSSNLIGTWVRPTCWSEIVSWVGGVGVGEQLWLTLGTHTLVVGISGSIHLHELSWRLTSWHQDLAPPNSL